MFIVLACICNYIRRYANLLRPGMQLDDAPSSDEEEELAQKTQEYAAFLK